MYLLFIVSVKTKSDASGHHIAKFGCKLQNCHATASLILRCLR